VRGIMLQKDQSVIALIIACPDAVNSATTVLTATKNGYGKRTPLGDYRNTAAAAGRDLDSGQRSATVP
jgi:DNA gyrase subunit A